MAMRIAVLLLMFLVGATAGEATGPAAKPEPDPVTVAIAEVLNGREPLVVDGRRLDVRALRQLYEPRGYRPVWNGSDERTGRGTEVADALVDARTHGLDPAPYHQQAIARRAAGTRPEDRAAFDVLASDALMRLVSHLRLGAVRPGTVDKDAAVDPRPVDQQALVLDAAAAPDLAAFLDGLAPQTPTYRGLVEALARYREIELGGGWPKVPVKGPALRPDATDPAVAAVRARLAATGELGEADAAPAEPALYDPALVAAVKEFQARHGLVADGVVGGPTRAALAMPVGDRIKQLVVNLERARWFSSEGARRYVAVNVPSFELVLVENGSTVLKMPVVVGRKDRRTPLLSAHITQLIFNPSWTVPPTIMRADFLPKMRQNESYASRRGMQFVGSALRQPPGPRNPLGKVKFLMPNGFSVYLHDTTAKGLMRQPRRALSSGCVRLGDALGLVNQLLADDPRWSPATRKRFLAGWTTRYLALREPVPIYLRYQTAWRDDEGDLQFRDDLYGRDAALARALGEEPATPTAAMPSA
jgi:murein L,D-transpeptidase YcbB/YkuD